MAKLDTGFLGQIQGSFGTSSVSDTGLTVLAWLGGVVAVLGVAAFVLKYLRMQARLREIPAGWIVNPSRIKENIQAAQDQRSKFEFSFHAEETAGMSVSCSIKEFGKGVITLDSCTVDKIGRDWVGRQVRCFFRVTSGKKKHMHFYAFSSKISGIKQLPGTMSEVMIAIPDRLELQQKRAHLRVEPPSDYVLGFAVWPERFDKGHAHDGHVAHWDKPNLIIMPKKRAGVRIVDVSAGGLRMKIDRAQAKESGLSFNITRQFFLLMDLFVPEKGAKLRIWAVGKVRQVFEDVDAVEVGMQFIKIGEPVPEEKKLLVWKTLDEDGITDLGNWAVRRQLELYREKGLA